MGHAHGGGFPGKEVWTGVEAPVLLIAGREDPITKAEEAIRIAEYLGHKYEASDEHTGSTSARPELGSRSNSEACAQSDAPASLVKLVILPSPASHALLYAPLTVRVISSHIQHFLACQITEQLSLGWQLQYMTTEGKWDVKNLAKWTAVEPVSAPIAGHFRAMKTLREVDGLHTPKAFVELWSRQNGEGRDGKGPIDAVVDISHDSPVYDPAGLTKGGITYRKFPTVSKLPPTLDEVRHFIDLVDQLRRELEDESPERDSSSIAVHCHYGFNRTGFFVVAYMVERLGWPLKEAIEEFGKNRPPGIRHAHFIDELWGRYWLGEENQA
jgi:protein-tyrosine phosphatase